MMLSLSLPLSLSRARSLSISLSEIYIYPTTGRWIPFHLCNHTRRTHFSLSLSVSLCNHTKRTHFAYIYIYLYLYNTNSVCLCVCVCVCLSSIGGQTAGPIMTTFGTHMRIYLGMVPTKYWPHEWPGSVGSLGPISESGLSCQLLLRAVVWQMTSQ